MISTISVNRGNNAVMRIGPKADQSKASSVSTVSAVSMSHHAIDGSPTSRDPRLQLTLPLTFTMMSAMCDNNINDDGNGTTTIRSTPPVFSTKTAPHQLTLYRS